MDYDSIRTVLAIQRTQSITKAAAMLHLSQSTVSQRLQLLEEELGIQIFIRHKGRQTVELTNKGELLLSIANQWMKNYEDAIAIKDNANRIRLRIGGVDSLNSYLFLDFFREFSRDNFFVDLTIRTHHSWEIYELLDLKEIDIGLANTDNEYAYVDIITELLFKEKYVVVQSSKNETQYKISEINPSELNFLDEVQQLFDQSYQRWHDQWWPRGSSKIVVYTSSMLVPFLQEENRWSIVPISIAKYLAKQIPLSIYNLSDAPPERTCFIAMHKHKKAANIKVIKDFIESIKQYLNKDNI